MKINNWENLITELKGFSHLMKKLLANETINIYPARLYESEGYFKFSLHGDLSSIEEYGHHRYNWKVIFDINGTGLLIMQSLQLG